MALTQTNSPIRRFYTQPAVQKFNREQEARLVATLRSLDNATSLTPANGPGDLQLSDDCTTRQGGFRYTAHGFKQVAGLLGPGVSRLIPDLSGTRPRDIPEDFLDGQLAIRMFNALVDRRFALFTAYRLIRNTTDRTVEGLVSGTHQYLDNVSFYNCVSESLQQAQPTVQFYAATMIGRRLFMWWRDREPFNQLRLGGRSWPCYRGYYCCNGESAGVSARTTAAIFTPVGVCLAPYRQFGGRVNHRGRNFTVRLSQEFGRAFSSELPLEEWREKIPTALGASLGFLPDKDTKARKQRLSWLATHLRRLSVDYTIAQEVLSAALLHGRNVSNPDAAPGMPQEQLFASRKALDLLVCLLHTARRLDMSRREKLEQAAFHLLVGKFF